MAHIILKTIKPNLKQAQQPVQKPVAQGLQPMVIDFSQNPASRLSTKIAYMLFGAMMSLLLTGIVALFILGNQVNHMWREAQQATSQQLKIIAEPETAFPAAALITPTTIAPLPSKALIVGKDFQKTKSPNNLELAPLLEKLPVYGQPSKPARNRASFVEVDKTSPLSKSASLQQQADDAVNSGQTSKAIELYLRALRLQPDDVTLRSNTVALLLQEARSFDELNDVPNAINAYKTAQSLWRGDNQTAQSIKARIEFLERN